MKRLFLVHIASEAPTARLVESDSKIGVVALQIAEEHAGKRKIRLFWHADGFMAEVRFKGESIEVTQINFNTASQFSEGYPAAGPHIKEWAASRAHRRMVGREVR